MISKSSNAGTAPRMTYSAFLLLLRVEPAEGIVELVLVSDKEDVAPVRVAPDVILGQVWVARVHRVEEPDRVDEGQKRDALPLHLLAVHVDLKVGRVEVDDRAVGLVHERLERARNVHLTEREGGRVQRIGASASARREREQSE